MRELKGLATGLGSLPHKNVQEALDLVFKRLPEIPFWPQLPRLGLKEQMVAQFSEGLPCLKVGPQGVTFDPRDKDKELEVFYDRIIAGDTEHFRISDEFAVGLHGFYDRLNQAIPPATEFLKLQITGPFTLAASIKDDKGQGLLHDPVFMQAVLKGLAMKAGWQIRLFSRFARKIILFLDEPYLGCFGSAYTPINREDVVKGLKEMASELKRFPEALLGVHCCGNTDWSIFTEVKEIDIISFDAFVFLDRFMLYAETLKGFLKKGGIICWGIVPTEGYTGRETASLLAEKIKAAFSNLKDKGLEGDLLSAGLLVSPSCGLGALSIDKAEKILTLLSEVSDRLRKNF